MKQMTATMRIPEKTVNELGYQMYASAFLEAAKAVAGVDMQLVVRLYLLCHSIELALKARLIKGGWDVGRLKDKAGHDLGKCLSEARAVGLQVEVDAQEEAELDKAAVLYNTKVKAFEYFLFGGARKEIKLRGDPMSDETVLRRLAEKLVAGCLK